MKDIYEGLTLAQVMGSDLNKEAIAELVAEGTHSDEEWEDVIYDDYDEVDFNPYMGCYDFDC